MADPLPKAKYLAAGNCHPVLALICSNRMPALSAAVMIDPPLNSTGHSMHDESGYFAGYAPWPPASVNSEDLSIVDPKPPIGIHLSPTFGK
jgi:hypothetical protein